MQDQLNQLARTTGRSKKDCLNLIVGNTNLNYSSQQAANIWASTNQLPLQDAINTRIGTTGLRKQEALNKIVFAPCINETAGSEARTSNGWIEDEKFGWGWRTGNAATSGGGFDATVTRTGTKTLKLLTATTGGSIEVTTRGIDAGWPTEASIIKYGIVAKPSTSYNISYYIKTNIRSGVVNNGAMVQVRAFSATGSTALATYQDSAWVKTTADWQPIEFDFTTHASTAYIAVTPSISSADAFDAWFDINSLIVKEN